MVREVDLEEYFLTDPQNRSQFIENVRNEFNEFEPAIPAKIELLLTYGRNKRFVNAGIAAEDILVSINSQYIFTALKKEFTKTPSIEKNENLLMLIHGIVLNFNFDIQTRIDTMLLHIRELKKPNTSTKIKNALYNGMRLLEAEVKLFMEEIHQGMELLELK